MKSIGINPVSAELRLATGAPYRMRFRVRGNDGNYAPLTGRKLVFSIYRGALATIQQLGTIATDSISDYALFAFDGTMPATVPASSGWEIGEPYTDGKGPMIAGSIYVADAAPNPGGGTYASGAYDDTTFSVATQTLIVIASGAPGRDGAGAGSGAGFSLHHGGYYPNVKYPIGRTYSSVIGKNDLYTVPAGRKALVYGCYDTNFTGGTIFYSPHIKIGGTYYQLGAGVSDNNTGTTHRYVFSGIGGSATIPIVMNAGESFAVDCDTAGVAFWTIALEFDAAHPMSRASLTGFAVGDNIVFTCPAGKTAQMGAIGYDANDTPTPRMTTMGYFNASGAPRTILNYLVPVGGTKGNVNKWNDPGAIGNGVGQYKGIPIPMGPGDFMVLNADSAAAGQFFWFNYLLADQ